MSLFGGGYLGACYLLAGAYLQPQRNVPTKPTLFLNTKVNDTPAWITPGLAKGDSGKVVFVFAHGYGGNRAHWSEVMVDLHKLGYESVVPAMPGQDASPIKDVGFGSSEGKVLAETFSWVREHAKTKPKIVVVGVSMGGAAAWLSSARDPSIDGVVSESAYASFGRAMNGWLDYVLPLGSSVLAPVVWFAKAKSGIDPDSINPVEAARGWRGRPALVLHAGNDQLISRWHGEQLSMAADCPLEIVAGAEHANCCTVLGKRYAQRLVAFAESLPPQPNAP